MKTSEKVAERISGWGPGAGLWDRIKNEDEE
jgi:hypothetical protein